MKQLKLRLASPEETDQIVEWLNATEDNMYDPDIWTRPTLQVLSAYDGDGARGYLPMQRVMMMESIALKPGMETTERAQAARDLAKGASLLANAQGIRELYFVSSHDTMIELAKRHGFEEIPGALLRIKL